MSTKTHARVHALGNAVRRLATAGQANDCPPAIPLLVGAAAAQLIADTACDSD